MMKGTSLLLVLHLAPFALGGLLRSPRVYNALVTSSENLTPSRAFPVLQPVLHETAIGYPLHGYTLSPLNSFSGYGPYLPAHVDYQNYHLQPYDTRHVDRPKHEDSKHQPAVEIIHRDIPPLPPNEHGPPGKQNPSHALPPVELEQHAPRKPVHDATGKPERLPPSLIPIQQYQIHDTIPYGYTGVPHLYYPYQLHTNFSPYPVLPPEYYRPPSSPQPPLRRRPVQPSPAEDKPDPSPDQPDSKFEDSKLVQPLQPDSRIPPPETGDNRNNAGKNPDVPDVPAPPPPIGKKPDASL